jgi:C4-dicarboxylate transporter, DctQ subunit
MLKALHAIDGVIAAIEKVVVVVMVVVLVGLPLCQIILRVAGEGGFPWGHEIVRVLVMWLAFFGASLATRERRHITIDLLDRAISPATKAVFNLITQAVAATVLAYLARTGWTFVGLQREMGDTSAVLGIPEWIAVTVIPTALAIMTWRLLIGIVEDLHGLKTGDFTYLAGPSAEGRLY